MQLKFLNLISSDGGFADVWLARDEELHRDLAVKIVREASVGISNALAHARALARAKHPNVVTVHAIEKVKDPTGRHDDVDAVVMELLDGQTLGGRFRGAPFTHEELRAIGSGLLSAISHIHAAGMVHGDLHEDNVMICGGEIKVIDLLHRYSLAASSVARVADQVGRELRAVKSMLQQLIGHSELTAPQISAFTESVRGDTTLELLTSAWNEVLAAAPGTKLRLEHPKTPLNLFTLVVPGLHRERVRGLLGAPDFVQAESWVYRYQETQVEVRFRNGDAVESVLMALCAGKKYHGIHPTAHTDAPLGDLTLKDVLDGGDSAEYFQSMRTKEVFVRGRWGPPSVWSYYSCGALHVFSGVGALADVDFDWDLSAGRLLTDPEKVLINWMAATEADHGDVPGFGWFIPA